MSSDFTSKTYVFKGIGVSPGIIIGKAYRYDPLDAEFSFFKLSDPALIPAEIKRFKNAVKESERQLRKVQKNLESTKISEPLYIIDVHILILKDKKFINRTVKYIRKMGINAEWAVRMTLDRYKQIFEDIEDSYIRSRISDVQYVSQRILRNLTGKKPETVWEIGDGVVVIAHDLSPADTAQMKMEKVLGFATDIGGRTSHTAIVARSMELPAVAGLESVTRAVHTGDSIIIDGSSGIVIVNPYEDILRRYEIKKQQYHLSREEFLKFARLPASTIDNHTVRIGGNVEFVEEIAPAVVHGAEYIGLYRTEFIYINQKNLPTEEDHFNAYSQVVKQSDLLWSTIRTFDLGGDKFRSDQKQVNELNPQMGLRAIRFCLQEVDLFKTQLRAIWRVSALGKIKILFPMISGVEEIREAKKLLEETRRELVEQGVAVAPKIEIGAMIEVPSAVVIADKLALEVDFFSIGTNDLIQYALAIDRANEKLSYLYEPLHPAVLRLLKRVVDVGHKANIPVAMCGEMAGDPMYTLVLLGLEIDELSMNHLGIPRIKRIIRQARLEDAKNLLKKVLSFGSAIETRAYVKKYMLQHFPDEFAKDEEE